MAGPFGCGGGGGSPVSTPTFGSVEVGFVDSPNTGYQAISLNVVSVPLQLGTPTEGIYGSVTGEQPWPAPPNSVAVVAFGGTT